MNAPPSRPSVPVVVWMATGMAAACVTAETLVRTRPAAVAVLLAVSCLGVLAAGRSSCRALAVCLTGLALGFAASGAQGWSMAKAMAAAADAGARQWVGVVEADPQEGAYGQVVRVRLRGGPLDGARARVSWPEGVALPELGERCAFSAIMKPVPLGEVWGRRAVRAGVCATGSAWSARRLGFGDGPVARLYEWRSTTLSSMKRVPGPGGDLLEGIVLGDRRRLLGTAAERDFQVLGLTHLVAVSGSHLALACAAAAFAGRLLRLPMRGIVIVTLLAGAAYALVTGLPYSALRSLLMLVVAGAGHLAGRRTNGLASLAIAVIAVLTIEPWSVYDLGLQLSVLAVAGLLLFGRLAGAWMREGLPRGMRAAAEPLGLTCVAQLTTMPVVASAFGMISVMAPVANAAAGALVSVALLLGLSGCIARGLVPPLGDVALRLSAAVLAATAWLAALLARVPGAAVAISGGVGIVAAVAVALAAVWVRWPLPGGARQGRLFTCSLLAASLALALGPAPPRKATVTVLDVGQGDAVLVRSAGRVMLVDAGPDALAMRRALARAAVRRIDVLVLTHAHDDHTGGAEAVRSVAEVASVGVSALDADGGEASFGRWGISERPLSAGDSWEVGEVSVRVLWPPGASQGELHENDRSVVLELSCGRFRAVLTGDAEEAAQQGMASAGSLHRADVLKVPHHGSSNGLTAEALDMWDPSVALISVGEGNDFGHPSCSTLAMLAAGHVRVERTDRAGDIVVHITKDGYRVSTRERGERRTVRERMRPAGRAACCTPRVNARTTRGDVGSQKHRRTQTRLSDLWRGGTAAGARSPPAQGPHRTGGRPGLQLRGVRRRECGRQ